MSKMTIAAACAASCRKVFITRDLYSRAARGIILILVLAISTAALPPAVQATASAATTSAEIQAEIDAIHAALDKVLEAMNNIPFSEMYGEDGMGAEYKRLWDEETRLRDELRDAQARYYEASLNEEIAKGNAESQEYLDYYNSLTYEDQMELLREEWDFHMKDREAEKAAADAVALAAKPITLVVNGRTVSTDSPPVIEGGRTLAPMRATVEAMGYIVAWDSGTQTVDIYDPETHDLRISLKIGSNRAKVSTGIYGVMDEKILDVPAKTINGRTMVPVRFIAETLGCTVNWDETTKTVRIIQNAG